MAVADEATRLLVPKAQAGALQAAAQAAGYEEWWAAPAIADSLMTYLQREGWPNRNLAHVRRAANLLLPKLLVAC